MNLIQKRDEAFQKYVETGERKWLRKFHETCDALGGSSRRMSNVLSEKFEEGARASLMKAFTADEFYQVLPGMQVQTTKGFSEKVYGFSSLLNVTDVRKDDRGITYVVLSESDNRLFFGTVEVNLVLNQIHCRISLKKGHAGHDIARENYKVLYGLSCLIQCPENENQTWQENRMDSHGNSRSFAPVDVSQEMVVYTVPFRRRVISSIKDTASRIGELIQSMKEGVAACLLSELGFFSIKVHYVTFGNLGTGRYSNAFSKSISHAGLVGVRSANDIAGIEELVATALSLGENAVLSVNGGWVPPELENSPEGTPKRPHLRRLRGEASVILVAHKDVPDAEQAKEVFVRQRNGEILSLDDVLFLEKFFSLHGIVYNQRNVHWSDGTLHGAYHLGGSDVARYAISQ